MTNNQHKYDSLFDTKDMIKRIHNLLLHPKKKLSWNVTIADIDINWVKQSLDNIVNQYVRSWLKIPITDTLDIIQLSKRTFGICYVMVSTKFPQCQISSSHP